MVDVDMINECNAVNRSGRKITMDLNHPLSWFFCYNCTRVHMDFVDLCIIFVSRSVVSMANICFH